MFAPYVREFWFVDLIYGQGFEGYPPTDFSLSDPAVEKLTNLSCFRYLDRTISGPLIADIERYCGLRKRYRWSRKPEFFGYQSIEPCLCTETYLHHPSRRHIKIVRRRGFGFTTLRTYIKSIGVFFYRRDSTMEEGSGDLWLTIDHLTELLPKLKNGGLIVTDGSNHGDHHHGKRNNLDYSPLWRHHGNRDSDPEALPESFNDRHSNRFECVGFAGFGLGPTWIWQVWKPDVQPKEEPVKQEKRKPSKKTVRRRKPELQHNKPIFESEGE